MSLISSWCLPRAVFVSFEIAFYGETELDFLRKTQLRYAYRKKSIFKPCKFTLCVWVCVGVAQSLFCLQQRVGVRIRIQCFCACHAYVMLSTEMRADI